MFDHLMAMLVEHNQDGGSCRLHATAMLCGAEKDLDYQAVGEYIEDLAAIGEGMFRCIIEDNKSDMVDNFGEDGRTDSGSKTRTVTTSSLVTAGGLWDIQLMTLVGFLLYVFICYFARDPVRQCGRGGGKTMELTWLQQE